MKKIIIIIVVLVALGVAGYFIYRNIRCSSDSKIEKVPLELWEPDWYGHPDNSEFVFAYGQAHGAMQRTVDASAIANAQAEMAKRVNSNVQTSADGSETIITSNVTLSGLQITQRQTIALDDGTFKTFIQVALLKTEFDKLSTE